MGINGLLKLLLPIQRKMCMTDFKGKKVAIDGFVWLHRAAFRYCVELCKDPTTPLLLPFLMSRIKMLKTCGVVPIVVFDGQSLPSKLITNTKRRTERAEALEKAKALEAMGKVPDAFPYYQKAVSINSQTVYVWIKELQKEGIEYIVSPYEADAQLAYLARTGYVDAVLTEDSDLVAYRCPLTLFKLDDSMHVMAIYYSEALQLTGLTPDNFTSMCIFSGCDYCDHINKLGIKTALKMLKELETPEAVIEAAAQDPKFTVPEGFKESFYSSLTTFLCARAFDPRTKELVYLAPPPPDAEQLGKALDRDLLLQLVLGKIDTVTLQPLEVLPISGSHSPYFSNKTSESQEFNPPHSSSLKYSRKALTPQREPIKRSNSKHFASYEKLEDPRKPVPKIMSYFQLDKSARLK